MTNTDLKFNSFVPKSSVHFSITSKDLFFIFLIFFIYDSHREKEREREAETQAEGEGEAGSPVSREPDAGLNPRTLRS